MNDPRSECAHQRTAALFAALVVATLLSCSRTSGAGTLADAEGAWGGCYAGTGLRPNAANDTGPAVGTSTMLLDSVAEPGARRFHARVAHGTTARAGFWERGGGDSIHVVVTGIYPPASYALRRERDRLVGTAHAVSGLPEVAVDTTAWPVDLARASCAPPLAQLGNIGPRIPPALRAELATMDSTDQAARQSMTAASVTDTGFMHRLARGDSARTERLEAIVAPWGWPAPSRAGETAAAGAFLVLQHSPSARFQRRMLPILDSLARVGEASGQDVALLTDRVLKGQGKPQRYGSQFDIKDGQLILWPITDSASVDARRAALGLMPLAEYMKFLESMYHARVRP
jgi:Family of unknown function (DUF6624)